ncbi:MAG TPA: Stp1/IreP family PP2C-type Ser/Thr phosphatase [Nitrospira sp.]|nr:Stp1/IreP family PP2C-type Ser/Thr phosphatase [Nitrospira sp.]
MRWTGAGQTDTGLVRPTNQDAFAVLNDHQLWIVADGMGGHPGGDIAAHTAVASLTKNASRQFGKTRTARSDPGRTLRDLVIQAHRDVLNRAKEQRALTGMGTTIVALVIEPDPRPLAHIIHAGDSRAYLLRDGMLRQLTRDHTVVEEYLRRGVINVHEAKKHPKRHVLTRALGIEPDVELKVRSECLESEDRLLLCTDGLTKMLEDDEIQSIVGREGPGLQDLCHALIEACLAKGGEDNVTVVLCAGESLPSRSPGH